MVFVDRVSIWLYDQPSQHGPIQFQISYLPTATISRQYALLQSFFLRGVLRCGLPQKLYFCPLFHNNHILLSLSVHLFEIKSFQYASKIATGAHTSTKQCTCSTALYSSIQCQSYTTVFKKRSSRRWLSKQRKIQFLLLWVFIEAFYQIFSIF